MIGDLSNELARVLALYRNRSEIFKGNGRTLAFSFKEIIRCHLFSKAISKGLTPIPNVRILDWDLDLVCLKGVSPDYLFVIRENNNDDYRQLMLFPNEIKKVVIAMTKSAVPSVDEGLTVVRLAKRPTQMIRGISVQSVVSEYSTIFEEVYGFEPLFSKVQMTSAAARMTMFWMSHGRGLDFNKYCRWVMKRARASVTNDNSEKIVTIQRLMDRNAVAEYIINNNENSYSNDWAKDGWNSLDS